MKDRRISDCPDGFIDLVNECVDELLLVVSTVLERYPANVGGNAMQELFMRVMIHYCQKDIELIREVTRLSIKNLSLMSEDVIKKLQERK
jgi:hypothetical protein